VEQLANVVFAQKRAEQLIAAGKSASDAHAEADAERSEHRTDAKFLLHSGLKSACLRILHDEEKRLYDSLLDVQKLRHRVAHTGHKPASQTALEAHRLCCQTVQWLARVAGMPVKSLYPDEKDIHLEGLSFSMGRFGPTLSLQKVRHEVVRD
jgi:hypothetical protein